MAAAVEAEVREILEEFGPSILEVCHGGWSDWQSCRDAALERFPRIRANVVHGFMVHRAIGAFDGHADVRMILQDETAKFLFRKRVLMRLKKADGNFLGSNIPTQAVLAFVDPQLTIPGLPDVQKVDVVYVLNELETAIERIAVTARDNDVRLWSYDIEDRRGALVLPLPQPIAPAEGGNVVRLRSRPDQRAKDRDENKRG
jgi:hypothetical protein